jgi:putative DNA primase/helicase
VSRADPPSAIEIPDADPLKLAFEEQSDLGNAERLKALAGGKLRWIEDLQLWAWYDGRRFDVERGGIAAQRLAHAVVRHIREESRALYELADRCEAGEEEAHALLTRLRGAKFDHGKLKALAAGLLKHALKSGSAGMTAGMLRQARSDLAALAEDFDTDPLAYNVLNGTIRFVPPGSPPHTNPGEPGGGWSIKFHPHDPADMLMQLAEVEYDPEADCPFWKERLARLQPDPEQLDALQILYGYTLLGLTSDQGFYVMQGRGNDGKTATHRALAALHGDYYRHAGVKTFLEGAERGGAEHRSDLVRLKGDVRFVTCDEPKKRAVWDGETIKQITGSLITARGSGERTEVTYEPHFKLIAECNKIPRAPSDDKGFRRRFRLFQWTVSLPDVGEPGHMPIDEVLRRLTAERSGILNWLIAGALKWLETRRIPQPAAMAGVLSDFWSASSPLLEWMAEWCDTSEREAKTPVKDLYDSFKDWHERQLPDEKVPTSTKFGNDLRDMQFPVWKDAKGIRWRKGIRLRSDALFEASGDAAASAVARATSLPAAGPPRATEPSGSDDFDDDEGFVP